MARKRRRRRAPPEHPEPSWDALHPTLDLHGETAEGARRRALQWLRDRQRDGERVVRIITGRGRHSPGPPVLRAEIADLLDSLRGSLVEAADPERSGGAFRVELRRAAPAAG
ncbi:MAG TPA: Smr/MutS family protein, partial [Longimicrobiaceae bacterium]|nr:Smr/MutS family protein [Longimicrobiaceae bacterium]